MKKRIVLISIFVVIVLFVAGCASSDVYNTMEPADGGDDAAYDYDQADEMEEATEEPVALDAGNVPADQAFAQEGDATGDDVTDGNTLPDYTLASLPNREVRMIVKDAELTLLVVDTDVAIDRVNQAAGDFGGYIISSRVWYEDWQGVGYKYASITLGVPVTSFERVMNRLRNLAIQVLDESASGQDVTDEYVDLQSRLDNLIATRDRIREFLDQAESVEESLMINEELAQIEAQIEEVQGRMNYLFDRSSYSTITVLIQPELPPVPEPTPIPTPTPTPIPTPEPPWNPGNTVRSAGHTLGDISKVLLDIAIWLGIVVVPLATPLALVVWFVSKGSRKRKDVP